MSEPRPPTVGRTPTLGPTVIINLEARLAAAPSSQLLAQVPWDGQSLDPDVLGARAMLAWLR